MCMVNKYPENIMKCIRQRWGLDENDTSKDSVIKEFEKILDAVDIICLNCVEDTLDNPDVCDSCPVRKLCIAINVNK